MKNAVLEKVKSIWRGWRNSFRYRFNLLPKGVRTLMDDRLSICHANECGKLKAGVCTACGCIVSKKTKSLTEYCPENMWNPQIYTLEGVPQFILISEIPKPLLPSFMAFNKMGTRYSGKQLKVMADNVDEPWATLDSWDKFVTWWEAELDK